MKRLLLAVLISIFSVPSFSYALSVSIQTGGTTYTPTDTNANENIYTIAGTYGSFSITNFGTGGARVESVEGSTDRLNLTGLRITNTSSTTTETLIINYSDLYNSTGSGYAGQQLAGAFSLASSTNIITSFAATTIACFEGCEFVFPNPIDGGTLSDPTGTLTATNRLSFGPLRETEGINPCGGSFTNCYYISGWTQVTLLPGQFVNLAGSHDIMVIEGAIDDSGIIADFNAHLAEFHEVPEPPTLMLLLAGMGPLGYWIHRKQQRR